MPLLMTALHVRSFRWLIELQAAPRSFNFCEPVGVQPSVGLLLNVPSVAEFLCLSGFFLSFEIVY